MAAEKDLDGNKADVRRARAGFMPKVTLGSTYNSSGYDGNGSGFSISDNTSDHQTQIGIRQTILDGGKTRTSIRQAAAQQRAANSDYESILQNRILAVTTAYFEVLRTRHLADISAQSVTEAEGQRRLIQARIDAGDAAKVDIFPVEVQIANAKLQKLQSDNNAKIAMTTLRNEMGFSDRSDLQLIDIKEPTFDMQTLEECVDCALKDRPEIGRSAAQIESAKASLSLAKLQRIPVPTASASFDRGIESASYDSQWSVGIGVTMNLFDGGAAAADVDGAKSSLDSTLLRSDQVKIDIEKDVEEAYLNFNNAIERMNASKSNVELAKTNLEVANEKYKQGLAIPLEVVSAQVSNADALAANAEAVYDCYIAQARLDNAMGRRAY